MIIELYGLPGSGKTTLAREIVKRTDFKSIKVNKKSELLFYNLLFLIKHPIRFFVTLFYLILNSKNLSMFYTKFMNSFLDRNAEYQKALRYDKAMLDEAYFQNILSVFEKEMNSKFLRKYLNFLLWPDVLIVFNINPDKCFERVGKRGYAIRSNFDREPEVKWKKIIAKNDRILKKNLDSLSLNYIIVDNKKTSLDIVKEINNQIKS